MAQMGHLTCVRVCVFVSVCVGGIRVSGRVEGRVATCVRPFIYFIRFYLIYTCFVLKALRPRTVSAWVCV